MNSYTIFLLVACMTCVLAAVPAEKPEAEKVADEPKPKREAALSSGGGYHGPSYKYLPPSASATSGGFDSYSSGHHDSYAGVGAGVGAYDIGGVVDGNSVGGHDIEHFVPKNPKVETFIIQTRPLGHAVEQTDAGYKYSGPSSSFGGGYSNHQIGSSLGNSFAHHGHGAVQQFKTIVLPAKGYSGGSHGSSAGYNRFAGSAAGYGYSKALGGGSHFHSGASANHVGSGYATKNIGYGTGPQSFGSGTSVSADHGHGHSLEVPHGGSGFSHGDQGGYEYQPPVPSHAHHSQSVPATSYGVPINDVSPQYHVSEPSVENVQPPSYAAGHKGLGHFGFVANKPQALHTNFIGSSKYENSYSNHGSPHTHSLAPNAHYAERAPFKPSLFLGASHIKSFPTEHSAPAYSHGISNQYLAPPTSDGYDYPPPSALYGAPSHSHAGVEHTEPVQEPEQAYLPPQIHPQASYIPPAATPADNYLPPHH